MPIAKDFFPTYNKLQISEQPEVLVGAIIKYLRDNYGLDPLQFINYEEDIEVIHSEISTKLMRYAEGKKYLFSEPGNSDKIFTTFSAYMQLIFLFNNVINEIQNGDISKPHLNIAKQLNNEDVILTFNWDTLMDRALEKVTDWNVTTGYYIQPKAIYDDGWRDNNELVYAKAPQLIKLHGSTNWLTSYMTIENGKWTLTQELSPETLYVYRDTKKPYDTYRGRYRGGYEPFSYGYYPPNIPDRGKRAPEGWNYASIKTNYDPRIENNISGDSGLVSMPAIIPPVKEKEYGLFGDVFSKLWAKAQESLSVTENIIIIGYSFPKTDWKTDELFRKAFCKRKSKPNIVIINPEPDYIKNRFMFDYGIEEEKIRVEKTYFDDKFDLSSVL